MLEAGLTVWSLIAASLRTIERPSMGECRQTALSYNPPAVPRSRDPVPVRCPLFLRHAEMKTSWQSAVVIDRICGNFDNFGQALARLIRAIFGTYRARRTRVGRDFPVTFRARRTASIASP